MRKLEMSELNRLSTEEFKKTSKFPVRVILDNVRSVLNVGSVFRTCDAFLIHRLYLCGVTPTPAANREMRKTALGGTESVDWEYYKHTTDLIPLLKKDRYRIIAVEQTTDSTLLKSFHIEEKTAFVFGNEVKGISQEVLDLCDGFLEIPQFGTKHSLNISVSAGIVLYKAVESLSQ